MELAPGTRIAGYGIEARIGRGGAGAVYRAHHAGLDRYAAIKILPERLLSDPAFLQRFQREARIIASLSHPSILAVYDFGEHNDLPYIAMEYVAGGTLRDLLGKPMPLARALTLATPLANALDYAHNRGVLHRDIKPANILMRDDGKPVLADFGLANILASESALTPAGSILGTPYYVSPEQAQGHKLNSRTDVYSFGVMLFEMLTGALPFENDAAAAVLLAHVTKAPPSPLLFNTELPLAVEAVLFKALAKDPEARFARVGELVRALRTVQAEAMLARAQPRDSAHTTLQLPARSPAGQERPDPSAWGSPASPAPAFVTPPAPAPEPPRRPPVMPQPITPPPPPQPVGEPAWPAADSPAWPLPSTPAPPPPVAAASGGNPRILIIAAAAAGGGLCAGIVLTASVLLLTR